MVELLLKYGANPNAKNDDGRTAEQVAEERDTPAWRSGCGLPSLGLLPIEHLLGDKP